MHLLYINLYFLTQVYSNLYRENRIPEYPGCTSGTLSSKHKQTKQQKKPLKITRVILSPLATNMK